MNRENFHNQLKQLENFSDDLEYWPQYNRVLSDMKL